ncbi:two-component system, OmpR family, sensor histidine kinase KdpD [Bryocella elongata]|uniref:histidine kinase n=1 Tax=Bryocella elongata TaxID=863522 RepID=A0A1H5WN60_9BACT|nr:ATP-binding protein [Bryocella elongata]SEG00733.1 two-component system, OmpR family, sensor histidine kinase KdpD [Bryocella elongata]
MRSIVAALCCSAILVAAGAALSRAVPLATAIPLFLMPLLYIAWRLPFNVAATACCATTLTLDFFFTEPRYTLRMSSAQDVATLACFLIVVLTISRLSSRLSEKTTTLIERDAAQLSLHHLAERCLVLDWRESLPTELCYTVRECFAFDEVSLWDDIESRYISTGTTTSREALQAAFMAAQDFDLPRSRQSIRLLRSGVRPIGSLQLQGSMPDESILGSIATLVALTLERARALTSEVQAQFEKNSEQLRSSVLDGLAHSIKTPLTTISVASAGVIAMGHMTEPQTRLLARIEDQAHYIAGLTDKLLRTARLDAKITPKRRVIDLLELTSDVLHELDSPAARRVERTGARNIISVSTDPELLRMALLQVAENALKYSPPESIVTIDLQAEGSYVTIAIHNDGSYIPPEESRLIFKRFYRSPRVEQSAPGTGLGLSVATRAIEALGGTIFLSSDPSSGTTFTITIPSGEEFDARFDSHRRR